jgi:phosphoribosylamine---glycine ligase
VSAPLLYSKNGDAAALAPRIGAQLFILNPTARKKQLYEGLASLAPPLEAALRGVPEFIISDMIGDQQHQTGALFDRLRRRYPVYGGGAIMDLLELDRGFGLSVAAQCGLRVPRSVIFDHGRGRDPASVDWDGDRQRIYRVKGHLPEAERFVEETGADLVLKPFSNLSTSLTYVAKTPEDMISRLKEAEAHREIPPRAPFMLQEKIEGVEISTEIWVVEGELVWPANGTIEVKRLFPGDVGPATGCMASTVFGYALPDPVPGADAPDRQIVRAMPKILRQTLGQGAFRRWLRRPRGPRDESYLPYHGVLDVNTIIAERDQKAYFVEFTPRLGYSALWSLLDLYDGDLHDLFRDAATGRLREMRLHPGYSHCIRCCIPPFPFHELVEDDPRALDLLMRRATDVTIHGPTDDPHVWLLDAKRVAGETRTAGFDGVVLEVTGRGATVESARDQAQALVREFDVPDLIWRVDSADRAIRDLAKLEAWGYETGRAREPVLTSGSATRAPQESS